MGLSKDPLKRKRQLANLEKNMARKGERSKNPNGRPRTTISTMVKEFEEQGMVAPTAQEISKLYVYIASQTEEEANAMMRNKELPMVTRIIAKGVLAKKGLDVIERIMDRAYGKEQRIDITTNGKDLKPEPLTIRFVANREELERIQNEVPEIPADAGKEA